MPLPLYSSFSCLVLSRLVSSHLGNLRHHLYTSLVQYPHFESSQATYRRVFGRDKQPRSLGQNLGCLPRVRQLLHVALDPRLAAINLCRRGPEHQETARRRWLSVVDVEVGRHGNIMWQRTEAAPRQAFVQHRRQEASVDDARMTAQVFANI